MKDLARHFARLFEYERDAHAKVLRSLESVPVEWRSGHAFKKAVANPWSHCGRSPALARPLGARSRLTE
jgi:hypothetical protein